MLGRKMKQRREGDPQSSTELEIVDMLQGTLSLGCWHLIRLEGGRGELLKPTAHGEVRESGAQWGRRQVQMKEAFQAVKFSSALLCHEGL